MPSSVPGIVFGEGSPFTSTVMSQNIGPAGDSSDLRRPSPTWPFANVIPELNSMWLKPGMALEPGTNFAARQAANAAQTSAPFGFPFFFPTINYNPGSYPIPAASPTDYQSAQTGLGGFRLPTSQSPYTLPADIQQEIDQANQAVESLKGFKTTELSGERGPAIEQAFGPEPKFNLEGSGGQSPLLPESFNLSEPTSPAVRNAQNVLDNMRPLNFNWPNEADLTSPARWADTGFNLSGVGNEGALDPSKFNLGANNFAPPGWTGAVGAAGAAIPMITSMITNNPKINAAAQGVGTGLTTAGTIGSMTGEAAAGSAGLGGLAGLSSVAGPMVGTAMLPIIMGKLYNTIQRSFPGLNLPGINPTQPTGFVPIPGAGGMFGNPMTGEIIQRKGRFGFEYAPQTREGNAISPEQARQWGMPIPNVDIAPAEMQRTNPWLYGRLMAAQENPEAQLQAAGPSGVSYGQPRNPDQAFSTNEVRDWTTPGWRAWDTGVKNIQAANPSLAPAEVWHQWTISPEGQAWGYNQMLKQFDKNRMDRG